MTPPSADLRSGDVFAGWRIVSIEGRNGGLLRRECVGCGKQKISYRSHFLRNCARPHALGIGCSACTVRQVFTTHGDCGSPENRAWNSLKYRCNNSHSSGYENYGGRGVKVCDRWLGRGGYAHFLEDMGRMPRPHMTVERENVNGDYSPENCHWATKSEQSRNTRTNVKLTAGGRTLILADWAIVTGIKYHTLCGRLRLGWSPERVVSVPPRLRRRISDRTTTTPLAVTEEHEGA